MVVVMYHYNVKKIIIYFKIFLMNINIININLTRMEKIIP